MIKHCVKSMRYCIVVILLSLISLSITAQVNYTMSKWRYSDPKPLGFTILDVKFFDNNFGIAVGAGGGIARTLDGGVKWQYGAFTFTSAAGLTTNGSFADISVPTATVAYTVGSNGMMAKTTDAGLNWSFVRTPLYANARNINACWFFDANNGYIAGQWNTPDSLPKLYRTTNGGATWDSLAAPAVNGTTKVGYIQNSTYPSINYPINAKAKEIYRMHFINPNLGYISGQGSPLFPGLGIPLVSNATTCAATTSQLTTGSQTASLLWKFENGSLTDYSISKERLGYTGYPAAAPFNCTQRYATVSQTAQQFRAFTVVSDSMVLLLSFNNNVVVRVRTGKNDSTLNVNLPGVYEKGRYEILNTGPSGAPFGYPAIPPTAQQTLFASNPYRIRKAANGKLYAAAGNGLLWTTVDTGRTWVQERSLPAGRNYSGFATWAFDFLPSGKLITMGQGGVIADSVPGTSFQSNYVLVGSNANKIDFVDCNNGMVVGGSQIAVTNNGGASWVAKHRPDFAASFYNISGFNYTRLNKSYFAVSNGIIYSSVDQATTLDPLYSNFNYQMNDVIGFGADTVYGLGYSQFSVAAANRKSSFFRSVNGGATWQTVDIAVTTTTPAFTAPTLNRMVFPSRNIGYASGSRNGVYKTTDGGLTWARISPFPALNEAVGGTAFTNYTGIYALNDNTVFVLGNIFTTTGIRRLYKTTDGGATWTDISSNIATLLPVGNMLNVMFHDINNGYVVGSNVVFTTTNGGTSWTMEAAPHTNLNNAIGFSQRSIPANTPFANRKVFIGGFAVGNGVPTIMEYGDTLNVNINSTETITSSCSNAPTGSITVNATGAIAPYSYRLNNGAFQASPTFNNIAPGNYTITINDAACGTYTKQVTVGVRQAPGVSAGPDKTILEGDAVTLDGQSSSVLTNIAWTPAASIISGANTLTPLVKPTATTTYNLVVTDASGCTQTDNATVTMVPYCIRIKNAFTPNGDAVNDRWIVTGGSNCTTQVVVNIYNRYGGLVYNNQNYNNEWDGTYKGKPVPDGTYYYVVSAKFINGAVQLFKGDVTILR
jgi:gliding motility-associated-like protein